MEQEYTPEQLKTIAYLNENGIDHIPNEPRVFFHKYGSFNIPPTTEQSTSGMEAEAFRQKIMALPAFQKQVTEVIEV